MAYNTDIHFHPYITYSSTEQSKNWTLDKFLQEAFRLSKYVGYNPIVPFRVAYTGKSWITSTVSGYYWTLGTLFMQNYSYTAEYPEICNVLMIIEYKRLYFGTIWHENKIPKCKFNLLSTITDIK